MWRKPEERACPSCSLGAALKLKPYHWSLLMLHHSSHRYICAQSCTTTMVLLGNYQTQSEPDHCLWTQSWPQLAIPHSGSLLVLLPACLLPLAHLRISWPSLVSGISNMILALPTSPLLVRTIQQKGSDFNPLLKVKTTTMHIFLQNTTQLVLYVHSAIFYWTGKKKSGTRFFFCPWKTQVQ